MTVLIDTSFLVALINRNDKNYQTCLAIAQSVQEKFVVATTVLPEATYLIEKMLGHQIMRQFVHQMLQPTWFIEPPNASDLQRTWQLLEQYKDSHLDFTDATLVAIGERLKIKRVFTLDQRHFRLVRPNHCIAFELIP